MKNPNYTEPVVAWNEEDKHTGLVKYGVNNYEHATSAVKSIPCPVRPPVIFIDLDERDFDAMDEEDSQYELVDNSLQLV